MDKYQFFWETMELCNWDKEGDDDLVLQPVIEYLAKQDDEDIFRFNDLMAELLYRLDTKALAEQYIQQEGFLSADGFLYARCVALINGAAYYQKALQGGCPEMWSMEFESLLYVPQTAWEHKYGEEWEYPHFAPLSFETGSNTKGWE